MQCDRVDNTEDEEMDKEIAEPDQTAPDDDHEVTLEDVVERRYEVLTSVWKDTIADIARPRA